MWFTIDNNLKQHMLKLPKPPCWRESKSAYRLPLHKDGKSRPIPRWSSDMTRNIISCWLRVGSEAMEGKNVMCLKSNAKRNALCVRKESARAMKETEKNAEAKEKADFCFDGASLRGSRWLSLSRQLFMRRRALMCSVPFLSFLFLFFLVSLITEKPSRLGVLFGITCFVRFGLDSITFSQTTLDECLFYYVEWGKSKKTFIVRLE